MPDFGIFRGFNEKLFGDKLYAGQLPTQLGLIGSESFGFIGLLDAYPTAAAAYSLRLLRSAYTGDAIRVRRASDNTEQDIGFVDGELDTSTLTFFCSGTNGFVKTWYDQSGNGYDATQITLANQPQIVSSGSVILDNGKPSVEFDGSDDRLDLGNIISDYTNSDVDVFTTMTANSSTQVGVAYNLSDGTYVVGLSFNRIAGEVCGTNVRPTVSQRPGDSYNNVQSIYSLLTSKSQSYLYNNGIVNTKSSLSRSNLDNTIGSSNRHIPMKMQEHIIYESDQSSNRTGIQENINTYYSIY